MLRTDLPVVSFHWPIVGSPPPSPNQPPAHCTTTPQPCPSHKGRTYCVSDKAPGQCDKPSVKTCPPCPPPPAPHANCKPPQKPCPVHKMNCCGADEAEDEGQTGAGGWIEWTAVPVPDMKGNYEQDVLYRVLKLFANSSVDDVRCKCSSTACSSN